MAVLQPLTTITSALRSIGALASGETPDAATANDCLTLLNEMLDQWSNEHLLLFTQNEIILELVGGKYQYNIGMSTSDVSCTFTASFAGTQMIVTNVASGALSNAMIIDSTTGVGALAAGTAITSFGTGFGGNASGAFGTYGTNAANTITSGTVTAHAVRPLKINSALVRIVNSATGTLDYPVEVYPYEKYQSIGIKTLPGPWPRGVYYQPTEPVGILNFWPNPSQGEMHLYCDMVLGSFQTLYDTVTMPQGYQGAMHWCLAELLMPEFGKADPGQVAMVTMQAAKARRMLKAVNQHPQMEAMFDPALQNRPTRDAGWILSGGSK